MQCTTFGIRIDIGGFIFISVSWWLSVFRKCFSNATNLLASFLGWYLVTLMKIDSFIRWMQCASGFLGSIVHAEVLTFRGFMRRTSFPQFFFLGLLMYVFTISFLVCNVFVSLHNLFSYSLHWFEIA